MRLIDQCVVPTGLSRTWQEVHHGIIAVEAGLAVGRPLDGSNPALPFKSCSFQELLTFEVYLEIVVEDHLDREFDGRNGRRTSWGWVYWIALVLVVFVLMPGITVVLWQFGPAKNLQEQDKQINDLDKRAAHIADVVEAMKGENVQELRQVVTSLSEQVQSLQRQLKQVDTSKVKQDVENALNFGPWKALSKTQQAAERELAEAGQNIAKWLDRVAQFEGSDDAMLVASDPELLKRYHLLTSSATETVASVDMLNDDLRDLARPVEEAMELGYMDTPPPDQLVNRIEKIRGEASTLRKKYRDVVQELDALLRLAPQEVPEDALGFEAALAIIKNEAADQRREEIRRRVVAEQERLIQEVADFKLAADKRAADAEKVRDRNIADAKVDAAKLVGESQAEMIVESAKLLAAEIARKVDLQKQQNAEKQLEHDYALAKPDIVRYLGPFIRDGYAQPHDGMNRQEGSKKKMSLSGIRSSKALEDSRDGKSRLAVLATVKNDRYQNDFPQFYGGEWGWERMDKEWLARAQELLRKFGDRMVKDGLLAE